METIIKSHTMATLLFLIFIYTFKIEFRSKMLAMIIFQFEQPNFKKQFLIIFKCIVITFFDASWYTNSVYAFE